MEFITYSPETRSVTIDGAAEGTQKTKYDDGEAVQLRRARKEESGFDWEALLGKIDVVVGKNLIVSDVKDICCISWFVGSRIKLDFADVYISPIAIDQAHRTFTVMKHHNHIAIEGSRIRVPSLHGMDGWARSERIKEACNFIKLAYTNL